MHQLSFPLPCAFGSSAAQPHRDQLAQTPNMPGKAWHTMIAGSLSHLKMLRIGHFLLP